MNNFEEILAKLVVAKSIVSTQDFKCPLAEALSDVLREADNLHYELWKERVSHGSEEPASPKLANYILNLDWKKLKRLGIIKETV